MSFQLPLILKNEEGKIKKAGFELEYTGIDLKEAAQIIVELFEGTIHEINRFSYKILFLGH